MAGGYDGTIRIDTSVDAKGVNVGTKKIARNVGGSLSGIMRAIKFIGVALGVAFSAKMIHSFFQNIMAGFDLMKSRAGGNIKAITTQFDALKGAIANVGVSLLIALTPIIIIVIGWLTKLFTILAAIIQVLFGVQTGMGAVADSTKDAGKAAKGALASFDQLNVLNKDTGSAEAGGVPGLPGLVVPPEMLASIETFKKKMLDFLQPVTDALGRLYEALKPLGQTIWAGLKWAWDNILVPLGTWVMNELLPHFLDLLGQAGRTLNEVLVALQPSWKKFWDETLKPLADWTGGKVIEFLDWLNERLAVLSQWIKDNPESFATIVNIILGLGVALYVLVNVLPTLISLAELLSLAIGTTTLVALGWIAVLALLIIVIGYVILHWTELKTTVLQLWEIVVFYIKKWSEDLGNAIYELTIKIGAYMWDVADKITNAFSRALDFVKGLFYSIFIDIENFVIDKINNILRLIDSVTGIDLGNIGNVVDNSQIQDSSDYYSRHIPRLATGAVIPPNSRFAAILGDQRSGMNIEAPADLIRQIVREEMSGQNIRISFEGNLGALVRELKPHIDKENIRRGGSLVSGGVTS